MEGWMRKWKESNGLCREKQHENKKTEVFNFLLLLRPLAKARGYGRGGGRRKDGGFI